MRDFPSVGWTVVLVPLDLIESRTVARMLIGTFYGFEPDKIINLRARRLAMDGEPSRIWWIMAIPKAAVDRRRAAPGNP